MFNKILLILVFISLFWFIWNSYAELSSDLPSVNCIWLPGCKNIDTKNLDLELQAWNIWAWIINSFIWELIQFVAVIAVISLILSGGLYLISWWEEEKVQKAKKWIIRSLAWVVISISAWWIIWILNNLTIW